MANQVVERQQEVVEELSFFDDWEDKYDYVISLAKQLPKFPEDKKIDTNLVRGCQSQVWFDSSLDQDKIHFIATSDALIVSGLIGLLIRVYDDASVTDILESNTNFIKEIGFGSNLSATRATGLKSMIDYIYSTAKKYQ
ncbi:SufE family protein [Francisella adeliensis]|uniref:Fe-S cluster assembly protein SufE n=1 Tax=Francisella adeliensis TaxID=2007306 RepID=A0A2Z4Y0U9_9GAMM|nr:SufE family protein [Francisella adeliensis]AXA34323.1 Fe-S cluster assembly protein SufE [Francisella adeliensis]MBK2084691.1 SufE family protein [Francisella adeliensis]MBK2096200.1 SufE family protein [Francisella adeliensis]QIW12570.1 SufE family protein [Francisella adeliensis]QIW14443.1 SufE family protein [Francisella adeliensis]